jgi:predicted regulator of Ras-like GTPase activity (Roadblock/LC7/MglB family)
MANSIIETEEKELKELQEKLQGIKEQEGIIGYILRGAKSAAIDLKDPKKIIEYAVLSSAAFEKSTEMTEAIEIGETKKIVLESEETKLLSMNINSNRLSIFMEKNIDHNKLYKSLK